MISPDIVQHTYRQISIEVSIQGDNINEYLFYNIREKKTNSQQNPVMQNTKEPPPQFDKIVKLIS